MILANSDSFAQAYPVLAVFDTASGTAVAVLPRTDLSASSRLAELADQVPAFENFVFAPYFRFAGVAAETFPNLESTAEVKTVL